MRSRRLSFLLLALYFVFIGGSAYYTLIFPVRVFHHIFVSGLMVLWYFRRWRGDGLPSTPLNVVLLAAVIVRVFTAATAFDPRMAFEHLWFVFLHLTIFFVLVDLFQRGRQRIIMETQFMLGALVVLITVLELASWYFGLGILPGAEVGWVDVIGPGAWLPTKPLQVSLAMNISTLLAGYVAPLITLTIGWALTARQRDYRQVLWLLASGLIVVLIFTFSRGGILSLAAGLGSLAAMRIAQAPRIKRIVSPAVVLGAAVTGGVLLVALLTVFQTQTLGDRVRLDMYRSASEMLVDYPVTGVGTGGFGRAYREYRSVNQLTRDRLASAHNFYLNTAAETGFPGIIVMVWFGVVTVRTWWATWRSQATSARKLRVEATIAALIGVCIHSLVDVFTTTPVVSLIVLLLAYSVVGHRTVLDDRPKGVRWAAGVCGLIALGYAVFLLQIDRAQSLYEGSMRQGDDALDMAYQAESIDPSLNLYDLQIAYLHTKTPRRKISNGR